MRGLSGRTGLALAVLAVAAPRAARAAEPIPAADADPAPPFSVVDLNGAPADLQALAAAGPVVLSFFATWCRPCALEIPHLAALQDRLRDRGVTVLGISLDDSTSVTELGWYVDRHVPYRVVHDPEGRLAALYNPDYTMPYTVVVGRGGRLRYVHRGYVPGDEVGLEAVVRALVDEEPEAADDGPTWTLSGQGLAESDLGEGRTAGFLRSRADAAWGPLTAGVRYDLEAVRGVDSPCLRGRPGHLYLEYTRPGLRLRGGDSYVVLGRGLLLSLKQVGAFGVETSVLGAEAEGSLGPVSARVLGGVTHYSEVPQTLVGRCAEVFNPVAGARIEGRAGPVTLGAHVLGTWREGSAARGDGFVRFEPLPGLEGLRGAGVTVEGAGLPGGIRLYAEAVAVEGTGDTGASGTGFVASLGIPAGVATITLDAKRYDNLDLTYKRPLRPGQEFDVFLPYNVPPTLEPLDLVFRKAPSTADATGGRARADVSVRPDLKVWASMYGGEQAVDELSIVHPLVGVRWEPRDEGRVNARLGWRREEFGEALEGFSGDWLHVDVDVARPLGGGHSVEVLLGWKAFFEGAADAEPLDRARRLPEFPSGDAAPGPGRGREVTWDGLAVVSYALAPWVEASAVLDYRQLPTPDARRGVHPSGTLTVRPTSDASVSLFGGSEPGGLRCTSGVCRVLPAFEGVRMEGAFRF